jgi:NAD(P)-dependent dehydrogenase (short-subunit alcohol dehydrogenase family)
MRFAGKTIVVTGSGKQRGLGQGILQRFADEGANCVVSDVAIDDEAKGVADELRGRCAATGAKVAAIACDVSDAGQCAALVDQAVAAMGSVDIFVNNAGIGFMMKPMLDVDPADWAKVIAVNLSGAFYGTQAAARAMIAANQRNGVRSGRIINIASQAAKTGFPHLPAYVSSKHGMIGLTRASAVELGVHGITVNAVCPNHVTTALGAEQNAYFSKLLGFATVEAYLANMAAKNPMGRPGLPSDTAAACAWLASDEAQYVTGEALNVSGGEEMH